MAVLTQKVTACADFLARDLPAHALPAHDPTGCVVIYGEWDGGFIAWASHGGADVAARRNPEVPILDLREETRA